MQGLSGAQEKVAATGEVMAVVTERTSKRQLSAAGSYDRMIQQMDRMEYLMAQEARNMRIAQDAYDQGHISKQRLADATDMLAIKYGQLRLAEQAKRDAMLASTAAMDGQTNAAMRLAAANDNARGSTANIAAQFQDIGVTAAMGMSPVMIALQQGTQLSSVLATMQNPLKGLGAALLGMLNPVSLLTIGFVALAAAAIQFFMGSESSSDQAETALDRHNAPLDEMLQGYEAVRDAAQAATDAAQNLPEGVVRSDLVASLQEQERAAEGLQQRINDSKKNLAETAAFLKQIDDIDLSDSGGALQTGVAQINMLEQLAISTASTRAELDAAATAARELYNSTDDPAIKAMADDTYLLAMELRRAKLEADSTTAALATLNNMSVMVEVQVSTEKAIAAIQQIQNLSRKRSVYRSSKPMRCGTHKTC